MTPKPNHLTTGIDIRSASFSHFLAKIMQKFTGRASVEKAWAISTDPLISDVEVKFTGNGSKTEITATNHVE